MSKRSFWQGAAVGIVGTLAVERWLRNTFERRVCSTGYQPEYYVHSYWLDSAGYYRTPANPPLVERRSEADVVIVGGGLTGLSAAWHLASRFPEQRIVVLEAARCGWGASGRNGGQALATNLHAIDHGLEWSFETRELMLQGLALIRHWSERYGLEFDGVERGYLVLLPPGNRRERAFLERTIEFLEAAKIPYEWLDRRRTEQRIRSDSYEGALWYRDGSVGLNPAKLVRGLQQIAEAAGAKVYEQTRVLHIEPGCPARLETDWGEIRAETVILATNAYTHKLGFFTNRYLPILNSVIATAPLTRAQLEAIGWTDGDMIVTSELGTRYFQLTPDWRIVVGGGGGAICYDGLLPTGPDREAIRRLEEYLFQLWPQLRGVPVTHGWTGVACIASDGLPSVGRLPEAGNILYALAYSGEGVTLSLAAGKILADLYANEDSRWSGFRVLNRKLPYVPPDPLRSIGFTVVRLWLG